MVPVVDELPLSRIVFDEAIYPRKSHDPQLVQRYADALDAIEARQQYLSISADDKLLDGKHRWLAYRKVLDGDDRTVKVFRYDVRSPHEQFQLAVRLNSDHGAQLSDDDKQQDAIRLYNFGYTYDTIAETLSVGKRKVSDWLSRTVKEEKDRRNRKIFDMWLACHTQQEIADAVGCPQQTVADQIRGFTDSVLQNRSGKAAAEHATGFEAPIYNIWKQQEKTPGSTHFGNSDVRWLDNLLYLYTQPLDVVVDPFAGGGSTIDVCNKRLRRFFVSDRKPIVEREHEIRQHDLTAGLPKVPRWKDVQLVYLDPPYWKQAEGRYSDDPTDLANMPLNQFHEILAGIIEAFALKLTDAYVALIIQPTQWKAPEKQFTDHVAEMLRRVRRPVEMRFSVPYESQQCTAQMVEWAKAHRQCLVLTREIIVWRV
ncbi:DNA methylase [Maioricimonas rarisocia]|uniref:DNA methylase n=1 Tax=Maioricimonas rarisocia TaxID=2528026 RepID=A0A517ZB25_9PLAN|nr:DNA methyltransferase [Maioricimonas rarisocia]QDU39694.1 DNA methylase [Maioricimonas rarisocia]